LLKKVIPADYAAKDLVAFFDESLFASFVLFTLSLRV
jgi:hypothetical protein